MTRMTKGGTVTGDKFIREMAVAYVFPRGWFPERSEGVRQLTPEETGEMIRATVCTDEPKGDG